MRNRMPMLESERRDRAKNQRMAVLVGLLAAGLAWWFFMGPGSVDLSFCDNPGVDTPQTVVLVDATDTWSSLRQMIVENQVLESLTPQRNIVVYPVEPGTNESVRAEPIFLKCNPGNMDQLSRAAGFNPDSWLTNFIGNRELVDRRYEEFKAEVSAAVIGVALGDPRATSPIMETLRWGAVNANSGSDEPLEVVVISDMLQNSPMMSFYTAGVELSDENARQLADLSALGSRELQGAELDVYLLSADIPNGFSRQDVLEFWELYLNYQGDGARIPILGASIRSIHRVD